MWLLPSWTDNVAFIEETRRHSKHRAKEILWFLTAADNAGRQQHCGGLGQWQGKANVGGRRRAQGPTITVGQVEQRRQSAKKREPLGGAHLP